MDVTAALQKPVAVRVQSKNVSVVQRVKIQTVVNHAVAVINHLHKKMLTVNLVSVTLIVIVWITKIPLLSQAKMNRRKFSKYLFHWCIWEIPKLKIKDIFFNAILQPLMSISFYTALPVRKQFSVYG